MDLGQRSRRLRRADSGGASRARVEPGAIGHAGGRGAQSRRLPMGGAETQAVAFVLATNRRAPLASAGATVSGLDRVSRRNLFHRIPLWRRNRTPVHTARYGPRVLPIPQRPHGPSRCDQRRGPHQGLTWRCMTASQPTTRKHQGTITRTRANFVTRVRTNALALPLRRTHRALRTRPLRPVRIISGSRESPPS